MRSAMVSTRLGCEGFPLTDGEEALFADDAETFARSAIALLQAPARREHLGEAGRRFVEAHYGWPAIVPRLKVVYRELGVNGGSGSGE
jgi:glycosyltransferase involved in cell wall biosynthesis